MCEGRTHFKRLRVSHDKKLHVLANGPSLGKFLDNIDSDPLVDKFCDFAAVNDFITDERCLKIKPRYYVLSDGKLSDLNIINEVMYHIYKSFMFEWKSIKAIDKFLLSIMSEAKELDLHVLLCLLMATNIPKKDLKNRPELYRLTKEKILEDPDKRDQIESLLVNLE
jgi:hypothetical protein